jgi:predicted RNA binding protein YcfA (HicA-like mRNA interferase family)
MMRGGHMKRRDVIRHLEGHGCALLREGGRHTIFYRAATRKTTSVPRHTEIRESLVRKICKDVEIPPP